MKKYVLSFSLIVAFAFYIALNNQSTLTVGSLTGTPVASNIGSSGNGAGANAPAGGTTPAQNNGGITGRIGGDDDSEAYAPAPAPAPTPAPASAPTPTPSSAQTGTFKNGTYTGSVADAFYGNVQVQAVIANGALNNVNVLQYPSDRGTSREINAIAMPQLVQEAIQAQSANVNIISGATQSSGAFQQSLADALAQAKA